MGGAIRPALAIGERNERHLVVVQVPTTKDAHLVAFLEAHALPIEILRRFGDEIDSFAQCQLVSLV